jgi:prevent-host-death family protein
MLVNIHEAKTHLSRLVEQAAAGEEIIIGKAGRPMARLVPYVAPRERRLSGALKGKLWVADDFDRTPDWLVEAFDGEAGEG